MPYYGGQRAKLPGSELFDDMPLRTKLYGLAIICMIVGVVCLGYGLLAGLQSAWTLTYDETTGQVFEQQRWSARTGFGAGHNDRRYYLKVLYRFGVENREFVGWRINYNLREWQDDEGRPCESFGSASERDEIGAQYPEGRQVTVYYNSADPSEAVLERSLMGLEQVCLFGGPLLFLFGLLYFRSLKNTEHLAEEDERRRRQGSINAD